MDRSRVLGPSVVLLGLITAGCPPAKSTTDGTPIPTETDTDTDTDSDTDADTDSDTDADTDTGTCAGVFDISQFDAACFQ